MLAIVDFFHAHKLQSHPDCSASLLQASQGARPLYTFGNRAKPNIIFKAQLVWLDLLSIDAGTPSMSTAYG